MKALSSLCWLLAVLLLALLTACNSRSGPPAPTMTDAPASTPTPSPAPMQSNPADRCPVTEPVWIKAPEDAAVQDPPGYGYYYVNEDLSIWVAAWWTGEGEYPLRASEEGIKTGWFRPAGAELEVTGQSIDGEVPAFHAHFPCCYSTCFQASGLYFPASGCWQINAKATDSELSFVVWVEPED